MTRPSYCPSSAAQAALDCCENRSFGLRNDLEKRIRDLHRTTQSHRKAVMLTAVQSLRREITARRSRFGLLRESQLWFAERLGEKNP